MSYGKRPIVQYMSTHVFNNAFYGFNDKTGLIPLSGASVQSCPSGRILRETGRKLYPGIHSSIKTIMTGVYDSISLLSGFIDANSGVFTLYNVDKAPELPDGLDFNPRGTSIQNGVPHKGQSVYTLGDVVAGGQFYAIKSTDLGSAAFINADFTTTTFYTITLVNSVTTLNASIIPPNKGTVIYIEISGTELTKLVFGQNFTGSLSDITPITNKKIVISYISDGISLLSLSQSGGGVPIPKYQVIQF